MVEDLSNCRCIKMRVSKLIEKLMKLDQDLDVGYNEIDTDHLNDGKILYDYETVLLVEVREDDEYNLFVSLR